MLSIRLLLAAVFVPMLIEARVAASNERTQFARGGVEPAGDVYAIMRVAYPAVFIALIAEDLWWPSSPNLIEGLIPLVDSKLLKWWAIYSLGDAWTFRVVVRPGAPLVASGPYRWLRHPNYVAVISELAGVALMSGARIAGPAGTLAFGALMFRRIVIEERALAASRR